jgi:hydroxyethylthiazole kinase-like uncharacterized protein yjeF
MPGKKAMALYASRTLRQIETHFSPLPLMQRAGAAVAAWAAELAADRAWPILILAGPGNNGGDALEAAHLLRQRFFKVCVVFAAEPQNLPADAGAAYQRFSTAGGQTQPTIPTDTRWSLIIDGLFGIGLTRAPAGYYAEWISQVQALATRDRCPLLALDCPSGLNADTGNIYGKAIVASHTLTFISGKPGLLTAEGPDHCGAIRIAALGLNLADKFPPDGHQVSPPDFAVNLQKRAKNTHKGTFGNAGILGGSKSMLGAALLAGRAALKMGAGKVYLGLLDAAAPSVDLLQPELMLRRADTLLACELHALACGPGLGQSAEASRLLELAIQAPLPLVLDADALNILAADSHLAGNLSQRSDPVILTPHPAEAARLLGCSVPEVQADRIAAAGQIARSYNAHVVLKGCGSVLTAVDGRWWINSTGNPGMASAGMGDVLSGIIVALLAQGWSAENALLGGVYLHGAAADDLLAQGIGPIGLSASEVIAAARQHLNRLTNLPQIGLC